MKNQTNNQKQEAARDVRCPVHNCVIGHYDPSDGLINVTFFCPKCRRQYTFTIAPRK